MPGLQVHDWLTLPWHPSPISFLNSRQHELSSASWKPPSLTSCHPSGVHSLDSSSKILESEGCHAHPYCASKDKSPEIRAMLTPHKLPNPHAWPHPQLPPLCSQFYCGDRSHCLILHRLDGLCIFSPYLLLCDLDKACNLSDPFFCSLISRADSWSHSGSLLCGVGVEPGEGGRGSSPVLSYVSVPYRSTTGPSRPSQRQVLQHA